MFRACIFSSVSAISCMMLRYCLSDILTLDIALRRSIGCRGASTSIRCFPLGEVPLNCIVGVSMRCSSPVAWSRMYCIVLMEWSSCLGSYDRPRTVFFVFMEWSVWDMVREVDFLYEALEPTPR